MRKKLALKLRHAGVQFINRQLVHFHAVLIDCHEEFSAIAVRIYDKCLTYIDDKMFEIFNSILSFIARHGRGIFRLISLVCTQAM